jgi:hypothetical protein
VLFFQVLPKTRTQTLLPLLLQLLQTQTVLRDLRLQADLQVTDRAQRVFPRASHSPKERTIKGEIRAWAKSPSTY